MSKREQHFERFGAWMFSVGFLAGLTIGYWWNALWTVVA